MGDRLRGVEQVGQPDEPVAVPIDDARPMAEVAAAAGFSVSADDRVVITRQVTEAEQERRERMEETAAAISEAVAIVRDLATEDPTVSDPYVDYRCTLCGDIHGSHDDDCAFARAVRWVSAHPVSGDQQ